MLYTLATDETLSPIEEKDVSRTDRDIPAPMSSLRCTETFNDDMWVTAKSGALNTATREGLERLANGTDVDNDEMESFEHVYEYISTLGCGSYGCTVLVRDHSDNPELLRVMKIALFDEFFAKEVLVYTHTDEEILKKRISPNFAIPTHWFVANELPPATSWANFYASLHKRSSAFEMCMHAKMNGCRMGYLVMEYGQEGTLNDFNRNVLSPLADDNRTLYHRVVRNVVFQLVSGLYAMELTGMEHRDLGANNIVLVRSGMRNNTVLQTMYPDNEDLKNRCYTYTYGEDKFEVKPVYEDEEIYMPLIVDFSMSEIGPPSSVVKDTVTNAWFRAPELIFFDSENPVFSTQADMFSLAISIMTMIMGHHPFVQGEGSLKPSKELVYDMDRMCDRKYYDKKRESQVRHLRGQREQRYYLLTYAWNMCRFLGMPSNKTMPGVESTPIYEILRRSYDQDLTESQRSQFGTAWSRLEQDVESHNTLLVYMLKKMLAWNPNDRPVSALELLQSLYFYPLRKVPSCINFTAAATRRSDGVMRTKTKISKGARHAPYHYTPSRRMYRLENEMGISQLYEQVSCV